MSITAHWLGQDADGNWKMYTRLLAFKNVLGKHTGEHLADELFAIIKQTGILHKVCLRVSVYRTCRPMLTYLPVRTDYARQRLE